MRSANVITTAMCYASHTCSSTEYCSAKCEAAITARLRVARTIIKADLAAVDLIVGIVMNVGGSSCNHHASSSQRRRLNSTLSAELVC